MGRLKTISVSELDAALDVATGKKETERLLAARIYKQGPSVPMIAEWFGTREQTIYRWFDRLETEPIEQAVQDRQRTGRPPKLAEPRRSEFRKAIQKPPAEAGYNQPTWTPELAQQFLKDRFSIEYSRRHVQRLLRDENSV